MQVTPLSLKAVEEDCLDKKLTFNGKKPFSKFVANQHLTTSSHGPILTFKTNKNDHYSVRIWLVQIRQILNLEKLGEN